MRLIGVDDILARIDRMAVTDDLATTIAVEMCRRLVEDTPTAERPRGVWKYHNDEHGVWWGCSECGKILRRPPNDKRFCSRCGAEMEREA